jgi:hypothetical protein
MMRQQAVSILQRRRAAGQRRAGGAGPKAGRRGADMHLPLAITMLAEQLLPIQQQMRDTRPIPMPTRRLVCAQRPVNA